MKSHYTAKEIAAAVGVTERSAQIRANKQCWPHEKCPVRGGNEYRFIYESLPIDIRRALLAYELDLSLEFIPPREIPETELKTLLSRFQSAPEYNRERAIARCEILDALAAYHKASGLAVTKAEEGFVELYKIQAAPGIAPEIYTTEPKFSIGTLRRWKRQFKASGLAGLLTEYGKKKGRGNAITPEMRLEIIGQISARPHIRPVRIWEIVKSKFNGNAPNKSTIYRFVNSWKEENKQLYTMMVDPSEWKNNCQPAAGSMSENVPHFGHTWEMDSTPTDVVTKDKKRCCIIGNIDVYSRLAVVVLSETSKSLAVAACMRKGFLKWGMPSVIRKDNGKDYVSHHIRAITTGMGIETPTLPKYTPEAKPHIERFFGTMTRQLEELLPGYVGHSVAERQEIRERRTWGEKIMKRPKKGEENDPVEVPLTMAELQVLIDRWIEAYERRPHGGINHVTPLEKAESCMTRPQKIQDERALDILLAPIGNPNGNVIGKKGIRVLRGTYWSNSFLDPDKKWIGKRATVRIDLKDRGTIYVFDWESKKFICTAVDPNYKGISYEDYIIGTKRLKKSIKQEVRDLSRLTANSVDPITVLLDTGEVVDTATGEVIEESTGATVLPYTPKADTPALREAAKALEPPEKVHGQADEIDGPAAIIDLASRRENESEPEMIIPKNIQKKAGKWDIPPPGDEIWQNPILAVQFFLEKEEAVGLDHVDRYHVNRLLEHYPWVGDFYEDKRMTLAETD